MEIVNKKGNPLGAELIAPRLKAGIPDEFLLSDQRGLDKDTQTLINQEIERSMAPAEEEREQLLQGVQGAGDVFKPQAAPPVNPLGGPVNVGLHEALNQRQQRDFETTNRDLERNAYLQSETGKADKAAKASNYLARTEQLRLHNFQYRMQKLELQKQLAMQEEAERGALISSIVGVAGTVIGGLIGGPAGGAVGGAAGSAAGKSVA